MKLPNQSRAVTTVKRLAMASAVVLPLSGLLSGMAYAAECSPLQPNRVNIVDLQKVMQGSTVAGVSFRVQTNLRNTNRYRTHAFNDEDRTTQRVSVARHSQQPPIQSILLRQNSNVSPNANVRHESDRVTVMRNPGNLLEFSATIYSHTYNAECPPGKQISKSTFKFDLNPALNSRPAKRVSARISGYSEQHSPRPRPGNGAPRPRT